MRFLPELCTWNDFFLARRRLRWMQRFLGGLPATAALLTAESAMLSLPVFNPSATILGLDPILAIGVGTVVGAFAAWTTGSMMFRMGHSWYRPEWHRAFTSREGDYARRVAGQRANVPPSPVQLTGTDFYGESVGSIRDYRHWVKRQHCLTESRKFKL